MLEKMDDFFNRRVVGYEAHQLNAIDSAGIFYPFTADCLPLKERAAVLDLGCGTGLELGYYFERNPGARVTAIDLAEEMLAVLKGKFPDKALTVIQGSYFDLPFEPMAFDAVVSVESLHHFTKMEKTSLYAKILEALRADGYFLLTDYFAETPEQERFFCQELLRLKREQGIEDDEFYHYDTPLTVEHERQALGEAGFSRIEILGQWGATYTIKAMR